MRYAWLALLVLVVGCDQPQPGGGVGLQNAPPGVPPVPPVPGVPTVVPAPAVANPALDSPQVIMEKAEVATQANDWPTYVGLLTPETHDKLVLQELHTHLLAIWGENAARERLKLAPVPPDKNQPLKFALGYWGKKGLAADKLQAVADMPKSPERIAALKALVAEVPNRQPWRPSYSPAMPSKAASAHAVPVKSRMWRFPVTLAA